MGFEITEEIACIGLIVAGVIWGVTNSALDFKIAKKMEPKKGESLILKLLKNWKFLFIFGLNQIGSIMFVVFIRYVEMAKGSTIANGISLLVSYLIEVYYKLVVISKKGVLGILLILGGLYLLAF
jgi:energy-converting hydrogenase Eha subunit C